MVRNLREAQDLDLSTLATRDNVEAVRFGLKGEIDNLRNDVMLAFEAAIADAKAETIKWVFGAIGFQTLIISEA